MQEIVTVAAVGRMFNSLALLFPVVGALIGVGALARGTDRVRSWRMGIGVGLIGPANWLLWWFYNALTDRNGLDTVRNFAVNVTVFVLIGLGIGIVLGYVQYRSATDAKSEIREQEEPTPSE